MKVVAAPPPVRPPLSLLNVCWMMQSLMSVLYPFVGLSVCLQPVTQLQYIFLLCSSFKMQTGYLLAGFIQKTTL